MIKQPGELKTIYKYQKMEPPNIPEINLQKAKLMRAELLIQTNKDQLIQHVKQLHNMDLSICISTTKVLSLHVHLYLQHITIQEQSNTIKCLDFGDDVLKHLEDHIYDEIMELNNCILGILPEDEIFCFLCGKGCHEAP